MRHIKTFDQFVILIIERNTIITMYHVYYIIICNYGRRQYKFTDFESSIFYS